MLMGTPKMKNLKIVWDFAKNAMIWCKEFAINVSNKNIASFKIFNDVGDLMMLYPPCISETRPISLL